MNAEDRQLAQEKAVGIQVYASPQTQAFTCIFKQRYTDFLVNEIQPNGQVLHLDESSPDFHRKRKLEAATTETSGHGSPSQKKPRTDAAETNKVTDSNAERQAPKASLKEAKDAAIASISESDRGELAGVFGDEVASSIVNLYASVIAHPERKARDHHSVKSEPIKEKSQRTEAHLCVRRIFHSKLETLTVQNQDAQSGSGTIISIKAAPPRSAGGGDSNGRNSDGQRGRTNWSELGGEYLHFTLYKENKDTMEILYFLASQMKLAIKHFSFAGTKDRRGVTVQRVAVHRVKRERLESLNRTARGWQLGGPWEYHSDGLDLGMLLGNEFRITLRDVKFAGEESGWSLNQRLQHAKVECTRATKALTEWGYLNYYGLQRFGTHSIGTHIIGMKMLKGDLKGAVDSVLAYDPALVSKDSINGSTEPGNGSEHNGGQRKIPQDDIARANAIHAFVTTGSSQDAIALLPGNRFQAEKGIIMHLGKRDRKLGTRPNENDFQGALMQIQRNLRLMYVHAYQSYVWNVVAGKRWELFGNKVVAGDLVIVGEKEQEEGVQTGAVGPVDEVDEDGEPIVHPSATVANGVDDGQASNSHNASAGGIADDPFVRGRPLSQAEVDSGRFSTFDIILPLPGYDVVYPSNAIGNFYEEFMASESGGGLDPHNMRRAWKDISLSGGYRKMMSRPLGGQVEVDARSYAQADEQMVETDLDKLKGLKISQRSENAAADTNSPATPTDEAQPESTGEPKKIAIVLKMQLGSSQYATMALRELTKGGAAHYQPDFSNSKR